MIKQNIIRTSLIFAISATIFSHYSYAETSSNIESEDVDQKVNLQKSSDTQHSKIKLSNENENINEFNHTSDETSNTEESQQESNETNSKEESKAEESQQESNETNSTEESTAEESQEESEEPNSTKESTAEESQEESEEPNSTKESIAEESQEESEEPNSTKESIAEESQQKSNETNSSEGPKKEKVNDKNQQKSGIEHIHKNNTSSSKEKNHTKYKTAQKSKNYKIDDSTIFKQEEHQNVRSKSMKSKQNQIIQPYNDNTSSNVYSKTTYQKDKSQNSISKTMFNQLFSRQLVENNHNNFEPTHLKQNNLYFQSDRRKESTYPSIYQIESRFSENILNRFNQYAKGAYKYNPYIINKVNHLDDNGEKITNKDFNRLIKKQKFDNQNLNILQEDSQYFRFQYFNPLNAKEYYKNLDEQVLSLITNDIGSMPDLKKPKTIHKDEVEEEQHKKVITSSHKKTESKSYIKTLNMILITTLILISSTVMIIYVYQKLKTKKK
ncbi:SdrH family protein [Staphylococcus hominis]|uniref:SdrH family protein n=1 Tax=Staphylococcus hominis TaxID=1290 RepID=UPI00265BB0FF|nr:SdrH family protein [Staphylococcus hominis]MDO0997081.1 SdrH family protein [Staphylococcus hominis]MEB5575675.1 SdrH family protein [Staphylococcus hominis]